MSLDRHPGWYDVVRRHWQKTTGFLLASHAPCLTIRDEEIRAVSGRVLVGHDLERLTAGSPPESWMMGVIVCPEDRIDPVVQWVQAHRADPSRVWFYLHPTAHHRQLLPWEDAGYETDQVDVVDDWQSLHRLFGLALNDQVYADWQDSDL